MRQPMVPPLPIRATVLVVGAAVLVGAAVPAQAFNLDGNPVLIPVVVHAVGYNQTEWRSDVWITNPGSPSQTATITYYPQGAAAQTTTAAIAPYGAVFFGDIVAKTFGRTSSKGMLVISVDAGSVEARARVYNVGNAAGEFGQAVPGLPVERLSRQGLISGISTAAGNRVSVGIANPTGLSYTATITYRDPVKGGVILENVPLGPHQLVQFDKVAERWNLAAEDAVTLEINTLTNDEVFYAYASVVRDDTGDDTFIFGTAPNAGPS